MINTAIFDMDGLLINSEPFWQKAEKIVFAKVGIEMTTAMCESVMGFRIDEVVEHWYNYRPWNNFSKEEVEQQVVDNVIELINTEGKLMDGVVEVLELLQSKELKIGLASSSAMRIINTVIDRFDIRKYFQFVHSAELEKYGKPHPDIYIHTAIQLNTASTSCLVFEDSFYGLIAAIAARMKTVAVPDQNAYDKSIFDIANKKIRSLNDFSENTLKELNTL